MFVVIELIEKRMPPLSDVEEIVCYCVTEDKAEQVLNALEFESINSDREQVKGKDFCYREVTPSKLHRH